MNTLVGTKGDGKKFLAFVLEPGNLHRLQQGDPIIFQVESMFPEGVPKKLELAISYSETPVADAMKLKGVSGVTLDERTPFQKTRPHCPECKSTIEQMAMLKPEGPLGIVFCPSCGCTLGVVRNV